MLTEQKALQCGLTCPHLPRAAEALTLGGTHVLAPVTVGRNVAASNRLIFVYSSQIRVQTGMVKEKRTNKTKIKIFRWDPEQKSKWGESSFMFH